MLKNVTGIRLPVYTWCQWEFFVCISDYKESKCVLWFSIESLALHTFVPVLNEDENILEMSMLHRDTNSVVNYAPNV